MDPDAGTSSTGDRTPEPIISITHYARRDGAFKISQHHSLIITGRRIICVKTDDLLTARRKEAGERKVTHQGLPGFFERILLPVWVNADFTSHFGKMHPDTIIAAHPDAEIIPLNNLISFVVMNGSSKRLIHAMLESDTRYWDIEITGRTKTGTRTIELSTQRYPDEILKNKSLKMLLGERLVPPPISYFGQLFGLER